jgi:hypothetical protein
MILQQIITKEDIFNLTQIFIPVLQNYMDNMSEVLRL